MARGKKPTGKRRKAKRSQKRTTESYLYSADNLSKLVPGLKKYAKRRTLKSHEKAAIARRENQLKNIPFLEPISKKEAKILGPRKVFLPGVQAVQLRGVDTRAGDKRHINKKGDIEVTRTNVKTGEIEKWIYWSLDRATVRSRPGMRDAGKKVFEKTLPIEKVSDLTAEAFEKYNIQEVHLWAHAGVVGEGFHTLQQFIDWVNEKWNQGRYISTRKYADNTIYESPSDPGKWVNGIAILLENPEYTARRKAIFEAEQREIKKQQKKNSRSKKRK